MCQAVPLMPPPCGHRCGLKGGHVAVVLSKFKRFFCHYIFLEGSAPERRQSSRGSQSQVTAGSTFVVSVQAMGRRFGSGHWCFPIPFTDPDRDPRPSGPAISKHKAISAPLRSPLSVSVCVIADAPRLGRLRERLTPSRRAV